MTGSRRDPNYDEPDLPEGEFGWHKLIDLDELPEGRVTTVTIGHESLCVSHISDGDYGCLPNACPHQGGPAGGGVDREGVAALPVARLRLLAEERHPARRVHDDSPGAYRTEVS